MILVCSYCRKHLGTKEPYDNSGYTHGMCSDCQQRLMRQLAGMSFDEYLDGFRVPVVIINPEGRVLAANRHAQEMLNKPVERLQGFLGGEAMECAYAKLPEGCGNTVHCPTCTIRNLVEKTIRAERSFSNVEVTLVTDEGERVMTVDTSFNDGLVQIVFGVESHTRGHVAKGYKTVTKGDYRGEKRTIKNNRC